MEIVEVVIKIPKRTYDNVSKIACIAYGDDAYYIGNAIAKGTVLPKGHGDLIDRKELLKQPMDLANFPSNYVIIASAIIEADKESEDRNADSN